MFLSVMIDSHHRVGLLSLASTLLKILPQQSRGTTPETMHYGTGFTWFSRYRRPIFFRLIRTEHFLEQAMSSEGRLRCIPLEVFPSYFFF